MSKLEKRKEKENNKKKGKEELEGVERAKVQLGRQKLRVALEDSATPHLEVVDLIEVVVVVVVVVVEGCQVGREKDVDGCQVNSKTHTHTNKKEERKREPKQHGADSRRGAKVKRNETGKIRWQENEKETEEKRKKETVGLSSSGKGNDSKMAVRRAAAAAAAAAAAGRGGGGGRRRGGVMAEKWRLLLLYRWR